MRRGGHGFSLIEVLVSISIIALLSALLVPALVGSRHSARRIQCLSQLRQLGMASQLYWDDNQGQAFRFRGASTDGGDVFWFGWIERGPEGTRRFDHRLGPLYPYLAGRKVTLCPALDYHASNFKPKAEGAISGYGYNIQLSSPPDASPVRITRVLTPAACVLFADTAQVNAFQPPASVDNPLLEEFFYVSTMEPTVHFRHQARANAVHCDGHAEAHRALPGSTDPRLPGERVGRLAPEKLKPF